MPAILTSLFDPSRVCGVVPRVLRGRPIPARARRASPAISRCSRPSTVIRRSNRYGAATVPGPRVFRVALDPAVIRAAIAEQRLPTGDLRGRRRWSGERLLVTSGTARAAPRAPGGGTRVHAKVAG